MVKKVIFLIMLVFPLLASAQKVIQMEKEGGVYKIPCMVNGARMKMIFDTGASSVSLSLAIANYLYENDYITKEDIVGKGKSQVADGSIVDHYVINLRDIEIAGMHLKNVEATVIAAQDAPLLLGQTAIQKLGAVTINGNLLIINNGSAETLEGTIQELRDKLDFLLMERRYEDCIEIYDQLYSMNELSVEEVYNYALCLYLQNYNEKALKVLKSIQDLQTLIERGKDIYRLFGDIYYDLDKFSEAIDNYKLSNERMEYELIEIAHNTESIADCYYYQELYKKAIEWYEKTLDMYPKIFGLEQDYLMRSAFNMLNKGEKPFRDEKYDKLVFRWLYCQKETGGISFERFFNTTERMAHANNKAARSYLNKIGWVE